MILIDIVINIFEWQKIREILILGYFGLTQA